MSPVPGLGHVTSYLHYTLFHYRNAHTSIRVMCHAHSYASHTRRFVLNERWSAYLRSSFAPASEENLSPQGVLTSMLCRDDTKPAFN